MMSEATRRKIDTHAKALMQRLEDERSKAHADMLCLHIVAEGIMVFAKRDGLPVTPEMAMERARNICQALTAEYDLVRK